MAERKKGKRKKECEGGACKHREDSGVEKVSSGREGRKDKEEKKPRSTSAA